VWVIRSHKIIQANDASGPTTISSVSGRVFEGIKLDHPVAKLLVHGTALAQVCEARFFSFTCSQRQAPWFQV